MAGFTTAAATAATGLLGTGLGLYKSIDAGKRARDAEEELRNYQRQNLDNAYKEIGISTLGSDLAREEGARTAATLTGALQMGGTRSVLGGLPKIVAATNDINRQGAFDLDQQAQRRAYAIAGDNARIEGITENRDIANIAGYSSQANAGRQDMWDGILGTGSGVAMGLQSLPGLINPQGTARPTVDPIMSTGAGAFQPTITGTTMVPEGGQPIPNYQQAPFYSFINPNYRF